MANEKGKGKGGKRPKKQPVAQRTARDILDEKAGFKAPLVEPQTNALFDAYSAVTDYDEELQRQAAESDRRFARLFGIGVAIVVAIVALVIFSGAATAGQLCEPSTDEYGRRLNISDGVRTNALRSCTVIAKDATGREVPTVFPASAPEGGACQPYDTTALDLIGTTSFRAWCENDIGRGAEVTATHTFPGIGAPGQPTLDVSTP